jgi:hypothetical protein
MRSMLTCRPDARTRATTTAQPGCSSPLANCTLIAREAGIGPGLSRPRRGAVVLTWAFGLERVTRIELALSAWEADVLPLNYTRAYLQLAVVAATEPACAVFAQTSYRTR